MSKQIKIQKIVKSMHNGKVNHAVRLSLAYRDEEYDLVIENAANTSFKPQFKEGYLQFDARNMSNETLGKFVAFADNMIGMGIPDAVASMVESCRRHATDGADSMSLYTPTRVTSNTHDAAPPALPPAPTPQDSVKSA